jgi:hypothetical protein
MAKIDLTLTPDEYKAQWIAANKSKLEPEKTAIFDAFLDLKHRADKVAAIDESYIPPWKTLRFDTAIKNYLITAGDKTPEQIAAALNADVEKVKETLKERSKGDKIIFVKVGDKYAAIKPETTT